MATSRQQRATAIQRALETWWNRHRRDLPWRRRSDPYAIWISEVMLQQTRVATATGYFERFLMRFPTVAALAAAPVWAVLVWVIGRCQQAAVFGSLVLV